MARAVAAVDCGTNSTRLLVVGDDGKRLSRLSRITRLGAGVDQTGELSSEAVSRTLSVLTEYAQVIRANGVAPGAVRAAATSATRDASNAEEFLSRAGEILGARPEVIEGTEEGRLSYLGATAGLEPGDGPFLVVDIGGGSTELIVGSQNDGDRLPAAVVSLELGCVRLTERQLPSDPPTPDEVAKARAEAHALLAASRRDEPAFSTGRRLIGLAGTVSAVTVLALGLEAFDEEAVHLAEIDRASVREVFGSLVAVPLAARREVRGLEPERADVILGGIVVLTEVMDVFGFDSYTASESDILDGIAFELRASA